MRFRQQFQMQTHPRQWRSQFVRDVSGKGYQTRLNAILREAMLRDQNKK